MVPTPSEAEQALEDFLEKYSRDYDVACQCLEKDRDVLLTFYDFPGAH